MSKGKHLGEFEQTVLFSLARLDREATGRDVYTELVDVTGRDVAVAAVHVTLGRLEDKGLVTVEMADGPEGLGRPIRYFVVSASGAEALRTCRMHWEQLWAGVRFDSGRGRR